MNNMSLQRETFDAFYREALPLLRKHKDEIAAWADIPLDVDVETYQTAEVIDVLRIFTARDELMELRGYAVFFVKPNVHYQGSLQAVQDVVYVDPDYRRGYAGIKLIRYSETQLKKEGVQAVYHHVKFAHPALGVILEREGYEPMEKIYGKRLDG